MIVARIALPVVAVAALTGCCCCGSPTPVTEATARVQAGADPVIVKVDGAQQASLSANTGTTFQLKPGAHDIALEVGSRPAITAKVTVKAGDDVFLGGHDTHCFAIVENPADMSAPEPRWDVDKGPVPTTWSLVKLLKPGESWPEGDDLTMVTSSPSSLTVELSDRLVAPMPCDAADTNAAITTGMTAFTDKVDKF